MFTSLFCPGSYSLEPTYRCCWRVLSDAAASQRSSKWGYRYKCDQAGHDNNLCFRTSSYGSPNPSNDVAFIYFFFKERERESNDRRNQKDFWVKLQLWLYLLSITYRLWMTKIPFKQQKAHDINNTPPQDRA